MPPLLTLLLLARILAEVLHDRLARARADGGISTLEVAIIVLGLMAVAGLLSAAIYTAVTTRTARIK
jgi:hypothetical protein